MPIINVSFVCSHHTNCKKTSSHISNICCPRMWSRLCFNARSKQDLARIKRKLKTGFFVRFSF